MGGFAGNVNTEFTQSAMIIDYVRVYQEDVVSVENNSNLEKATGVYPNPTNDKIYITSNITPSQLVLYDTFGQLILSKEMDTDHLEVSHLNSGVYFIEIILNEEKIIRKVIIN